MGDFRCVGEATLGEWNEVFWGRRVADVREVFWGERDGTKGVLEKSFFFRSL